MFLYRFRELDCDVMRTISFLVMHNVVRSMAGERGVLLETLSNDCVCLEY